MNGCKEDQDRKLPKATIEDLEQEIVYLGSVVYNQRQKIKLLESQLASQSQEEG